jgi:hypothetical protein
MTPDKLTRQLNAWGEIAELANHGWDLPPAATAALDKMCRAIAKRGMADAKRIAELEAMTKWTPWKCPTCGTTNDEGTIMDKRSCEHELHTLRVSVARVAQAASVSLAAVGLPDDADYGAICDAARTRERGWNTLALDIVLGVR